MKASGWLAGLVLLVSLGGCVNPPPPVNSIQALDTTRVTMVQVQLKHDPELASSRITVSAQNDLLVLDGVVPTEGAKARAETLAKTVDGIYKIANHLQVSHEGDPPTP